MIFSKPAYYETNTEWFYIDPRYMTSKLTDKAPPKAIESYVERYCQLDGSCIGLADDEWEKLCKKIYEQTYADIKDFKANKNRYTFERTDRGILVLSKIDGKPVEQLPKQ